MADGPRIPELAQRDRFVRRAIAEGRVLTLADEEHASVSSQKLRGRTVQLFWSTSIEAKRWAEALSGNLDLQEIPLAAFAADILPGIAAARGLAGTDWVSDPIEAEVDPRDLLIRLQAEAMPGYATALILSGEAYFIAEASALKLSPSPRGDGREVVQVFTGRAEAERRMKKTGGDKISTATIAELVNTLLPWAIGRGHALLIEPIAGAGFVEVRTEDVKRLLDISYPGPIGAADAGESLDDAPKKSRRF